MCLTHKNCIINVVIIIIIIIIIIITAKRMTYFGTSRQSSILYGKSISMLPFNQQTVYIITWRKNDI